MCVHVLLQKIVDLSCSDMDTEQDGKVFGAMNLNIHSLNTLAILNTTNNLLKCAIIYLELNNSSFHKIPNDASC